MGQQTSLTSLSIPPTNKTYPRQFTQAISKLSEIQEVGSRQQKQLLQEIGLLVRRKADLVFENKQLTRELNSLQSRRDAIITGLEDFAKQRLKELEDLTKGIKYEGLEFVMKLRHQLDERESTLSESSHMLDQTLAEIERSDADLRKREEIVSRQGISIQLREENVTKRLTAVSEAEKYVENAKNEAKTSLDDAKLMEKKAEEHMETVSNVLDKRKSALDIKEKTLKLLEMDLGKRSGKLDAWEKRLQDKEETLKRGFARLKQQKAAG